MTNKKYNKSIIAIILNGLGSAYLFIAMLCPFIFVSEIFKTGLTDDTWGILFTAPFLFIVGIILRKCGKKIEDRKVFKSWLKTITENECIEKIKNDDIFAKTVYDNCPNKKCQKYVVELNNDVVNK